MPLDASKYYLIRSSSGASVLCYRGDATPKLISGGARYNVVNRARRKSTVQWDGDDPYRMDVPILLDGWMMQISVENDISKLNMMMRSIGDLIPPVKVFVDGAVPVKGGKWVIETIDWGDMVIWSAKQSTKGYRLRQDAVLHLLQFVEPKVLQVATPNTATPKVVKSGESAAKIARDHNTTVAALLKANNLRDAKQIKAHMRLVVPNNPLDIVNW